MVRTSGTHLQGHVNATYEELVRVFGEPNGYSDGYKTDVEWAFNITRNGRQVATIYNWKNGPNYMGGAGIPVDKITRWHIGGFTQLAVKWVEASLGRVV